MLRLRPIPDGQNGMSVTYLAVTWFHSGRIRPLSGTWGSATSLLSCLILQHFFGVWGVAALIIGIFIFGIPLITRYLNETRLEDPAEIVLDETCGIALVALVIPPSLSWWWLLAFPLFRLLDMLKYGPVGWCDRRIKGAWGVLLDDVVAGLMTAFLMILVFLFVQGF
jgi:phosphatidylglycerophosphatase A